MTKEINIIEGNITKKLSDETRKTLLDVIDKAITKVSKDLRYSHRLREDMHKLVDEFCLKQETQLFFRARAVHLFLERLEEMKERYEAMEEEIGEIQGYVGMYP